MSEKKDTLRGSPREDDPRARAAARAAQIREGGLDVDGIADKFYVDPNAIPDGWTYEWKRWRIYGKEDPTYEVEMSRRGWDPVPATRHPELVPSGWKHQHIEIDGMILMERPSEITDEFRKAEEKRARQQVRAKEEQLNDAPPGTFDRVDGKGRETAKVKRSFEPMPIAKD